MVKHVTIYHQPERFAGWPANYGIWQWDNEIVVGYTVGYMNPDGGFHARDTSRPFINQQSRSVDGGQTWQAEPFNGERPFDCGLSADEHMQQHLRLSDKSDNQSLGSTPPILDFSHADVALMFARTGLHKGTRSFFYYSQDRCHHWQGPFSLPLFDQTGIMARTDYLLEDQHKALAFLTANKTNGKEGKIICVRTTDGGQSWELASTVGDEPAGAQDFAIMPASLKLPGGRMLCAVRAHRETDHSNWIDLYQSDDNAGTWTHLSRPVDFGTNSNHGNPPTLNRLSDGRLVITYGNRLPPYTIEAVTSSDNGVTWDNPIILATGAGNHDIGYPRTVALPDDTLVTAYYFNDHPRRERYIQAAIWSL